MMDDSVATDAEGYLKKLQDWTPSIAEAMATEDNISLTAAHWEVIQFLRDYYAEYQIAPPMRTLTRKIGETLGRDKASSPYLYGLFPYGPSKQASRYAGLPKPTRCI